MPVSPKRQPALGESWDVSHKPGLYQLLGQQQRNLLMCKTSLPPSSQHPSPGLSPGPAEHSRMEPS